MVTDIKDGRKIIYRRRRVVVGARRLLRGGHCSCRRQIQMLLREKNMKRNE